MSSRDVGLKPFTPTTLYVFSPGSLTHVKKFTHLCVDVGEVQELVSTFRCRRQSDGEVQEADGEITCRNLSYQNISHKSHIFSDRWPEMVYCTSRRNVSHLDREVKLRTDVIHGFDICYDWSGSLSHEEINV